MIENNERFLDAEKLTKEKLTMALNDAIEQIERHMHIFSGTMEYNVNGEIITIHEGNGIFINARQMHYGVSNSKEECEYICILLHPMMLCTSSSIDRNFVSPFIADNSTPYILLDKSINWQKEILNDVEKMYNYRIIHQHSYTFKICFIIYGYCLPKTQ